jgi:hypothetical protein
MVAVRKISRLRRVVIQRRSSLKVQGAAEKGCAKVLKSFFLSFWSPWVKKSLTCSQKGTP